MSGSSYSSHFWSPYMSVVALPFRPANTMQSEYYCLYCKDSDVVIDTSFGDAICRGCGLVVCERMPSMEAEWKNYDGDGDDTTHKARASVASECDDGTLFFSGGTKKERDFLTQIQKQFNTKKEQRIIENVADVSELVYTLGLGNQVKVSVTDDTMIMISMLCYAMLHLVSKNLY